MCACIHVCVCVRERARACVLAWVHVCMYGCVCVPGLSMIVWVHVCIRTLVRAFVRVCIRASVSGETAGSSNIYIK